MCPLKIDAFHERTTSAKIVLRRKKVASPYPMAGKQPREHHAVQPVEQTEEETNNRSHLPPLRAGQYVYVATFTRDARDESASRRADATVIGVYPSEEDGWKAA